MGGTFNSSTQPEACVRAARKHRLQAA